MRIVQVVDSLETGGLERLAVDLALAHRAAGHESGLYCLFGRGELAAEADGAGIPVLSFDKQPGFSPAVVLRMARSLRRSRAGVVHSHNPGCHLYAALAARLAGVPVVVNTRHGPANSQGRGYQERHFRALMPLTSHVVFVSEDSRRFLSERHKLPLAKSSVILNGIPLERFLACPAAPGSARPRIRFGTVGRMVPAKAHADLLEAFALLLKRIPEAELRIVGGGSLMEDLAARARRLGIGDRARLEGLNFGIPEVLRCLDVFVLSSVTEGLPVVILEAMAAGLPIVSTRVGGVPEAAPEGEVARYSPPGRPDLLAAAMMEAACDPRLAEKGAAARRTAAGRFDISRMRREYENLFRGLGGDRR